MIILRDAFPKRNANDRKVRKQVARRLRANRFPRNIAVTFDRAQASCWRDGQTMMAYCLADLVKYHDWRRVTAR